LVTISFKAHRPAAQSVLRLSEWVKQIEMFASTEGGILDSSREKLNPTTPINGTVSIGLLDDDPSVLKGIGRLLSSAGWKVESFTDPHAFLGYARAHQPPVAVIDIRMPVMDGLEVQKRLREVSQSTRVVVLTSKDDPAIRAKAISAGASGFFLKAVDDEEFLAGVRSAFNGN
jgi:FixJ family two-component response regulator